MAINQFQAKFRNGQPIPAVAMSGHTVRGGRFVKQSGGKDDNGVIQIIECSAGDRALGSTEYDCDDTNNQRTAVTRPGDVARVVPGGTITAGDAIQSDSQGRAITLASSVAAALDTGVVGSNNAITWTAHTPGAAGNNITIALTNPGGTVTAEAVTVVGTAISVAARTSSGAITSTAAQIEAAVQAHGAASALVNVANKSTSTGAGTVAAVSATDLANGADPEGGGHVLGTANTSVTVSDSFVEVATP